MKQSLSFLVLILSFSCTQNSEPAGIVGSYELMEWQGVKADGSTVFPYGKKATGQLIYLQNGTMSMHLEGDQRPELGTDDYSLLDSLTVLNAYKTYFSYYGSYSIDTSQNLVIHRIAGCKNPDWKGRELKRKYELSADELIIRSDSIIGMDHVLRWRRISPEDVE